MANAKGGTFTGPRGNPGTSPKELLTEVYGTAKVREIIRIGSYYWPPVWVYENPTASLAHFLKGEHDG
jgi:hypothetical protein